MSRLHDLLTNQAIQSPDAVSAIFGDETVSFGGLDQDALRIAGGLCALGVESGARVGLYMSRSHELLAAIFGILRAGGVVVPIDVDDPGERREVILEHAEAELVLTDGHVADSPSCARMVAVGELPAGKPGSDEVKPEGPAFIFYTSGSTGVPKGVVLSHRALLSGQQWLQRTFPLERGERHLLRTTLSVTNLIREVFWPMLSGGMIVITPSGQHKDPQRLAELVHEHGICTILVVPALLEGLIETPAFCATDSLKYLFCSSDVMSGDLPRRYFATGGTARLYNIYGLTEALYCTYWECLPDIEYPGFVPVGHAADLTPHILDAEMRPVPDGNPGELCMSGVGMADGYYKDPDLTATRFVKAEHGDWFRTGDLARIDDDGCCQLMGRIDTQVKIAGHRVELGEVESALREVPGVLQAVVVGRRRVSGQQRLIAYLIVDEDAMPSTTHIRSHLATKIPNYMIPAAFILVDEIPQTHNGKVDRVALEQVTGNHLEIAEDYTAPEGKLSAYLCELWGDVLEHSRIGVHDNFFALGGESIQGFLLSAKLNRIGIGLPATQVFQTPTIAEMALHIESVLESPQAVTKALARRASSERPSADASEPAEEFHDAYEEAARLAEKPDVIERLYPLTDMQKGMLFHSLLDPGSGVYCEQFIHTLKGDLDLETYNHAWQAVVDRHEILRVWIALQGMQEPHQVVQREATLEWTVCDWRQESGAQQTLLEDYLREDRRRGFDYTQAPLFRLAVMRMEDRTFKLVMSYHHLILDAWSLFVLLRDSLELYSAQLEGRSPQLAPTRSFGDYVALLKKEEQDAARAYWQERLRGFRRPTMVSGVERLTLSASDLELHSETRLDLGGELSGALMEYARRRRLTLNSLVQGAWALVLGRLSGQADICFGITITHRPVALEGVENLVGIFINSLPIRIGIAPKLRVDDWLQEIQDTQVAARTHEHYSLPLIQQRSELPSDQPLFETLLIFENFPRGVGWSGRGGIEVRQERYIGWTNYPFAIEAMPDETLYFQVKYDRAFFSAARVEEVLETFRTILECVASGRNERLVDIVGQAQAQMPVAADGGADTLPMRGTVAEREEGEVSFAETPEEQALAGIWRDVLDLSVVDVETRFLALGGNSLAAMRVLALSQRDGFEFELTDLFGPDSTIRKLARATSLAAN